MRPAGLTLPELLQRSAQLGQALAAHVHGGAVGKQHALGREMVHVLQKWRPARSPRSAIATRAAPARSAARPTRITPLATSLTAPPALTKRFRPTSPPPSPRPSFSPRRAIPRPRLSPGRALPRQPAWRPESPLGAAEVRGVSPGPSRFPLRAGFLPRGRRAFVCFGVGMGWTEHVPNQPIGKSEPRHA